MSKVVILDGDCVVSTREHGEYAEGYPWQIIRNAQREIDCGVFVPCKHATARRETRHNYDKTRSWDVMVYQIPLLIMAHNEGHCNVTELCADCVVEALRGLDTNGR